ncbi:MAG: DUF3575 domain-containing protein [Gloeobacteraceae cyanobacterium ES-bin-316]|nr:DUF3575 domain-containing protein [Ferruginibacter sp.]
MKKVILILFLTTCSTALLAQETKDNDVDDGTAAKKNIVKLNLPALAFKNITVQYERAIAKKITVAGTFRFMPKGTIPFKNSIVKLADDNEIERQLNNLQIGNTAFMPEIRFYVGKKGAFHGFYLAPYANIARYSASLLLEYDDNGATKTIPMAGSVNSFTGGLMLGAQWKLSKALYLDWWILGPNYGRSNGDINGQKTLTASEQQSLRDELADLDVPLTDFTYDVNGNGATINFKGPWAGVRSGICIGINF